MESEQLLIKRALRGEESAVESLIDAYKHYVFAIIFNVVRNAQDTENLAQETFLKMLRSLSSFQGQSFKSWLGKIAVNQAIDWNRKKQREAEKNLAFQQQWAGGQQLPSVEEQVIHSEELKQLSILLNQMPEKYSRVLNQYFIEEKTYQEIAQKEGVSVRTIETRLYRGKKLLNQAWKGEG